ncbi:hypothetical protein BV22DRAFT_1129143 [Leucogyrophana mollusca]|uniref:Uncharacterized protein n=1 Tax=Leucogyrophana mollusca TaxID=85980 RepID=A0ACB8BKF1_9AGAM|nr:hypothetical protein BV22DRAFT_1129143 [Leucogyrophana mollusca]
MPKLGAGTPLALDKSPNIIMFGEVSSGKRSVVNLIAGEPITRTSASGCTSDMQRYDVHVAGRLLHLWDTVDLNQPSSEANNHLVTIEKTYKLIRSFEQTGGVSLLIYCMRGDKISAAAQSNYRLFYEILCGKQVPVIFIFTNPGDKPFATDWWEVHQGMFDGLGMHSVGHACVTTELPPAQDGTYGEKYEESREMMHSVLQAQYGYTERRQQEKRVLPDWWRSRSLGPIHLRTVGDLEMRLNKQCGFSKADAEYLARRIEALSKVDSGPSLTGPSNVYTRRPPGVESPPMSQTEPQANNFQIPNLFHDISHRGSSWTDSDSVLDVRL